MNPKNIPLLVAVAVFGLVFLVATFSLAPKNKPNSKDAAGVGESQVAAEGSSSGVASGHDPYGSKHISSGNPLSSLLSSLFTKRDADKPQLFGADGPVTIDQVPLGRFRRQLVALEKPALQEALSKLGELKVPLVDVNSLHVSKDGSLFYACRSMAVVPEPLPPEATAPSQSKISITTQPACSSRPGATNTIYLNSLDILYLEIS
jgi:hypothetical protein